MLQLFGRQCINDDGCRSGICLEDLAFHPNCSGHVLSTIDFIGDDSAPKGISRTFLQHKAASLLVERQQVSQQVARENDATGHRRLGGNQGP